MKTRLERLRDQLSEKSLPALFLSGLQNLGYVSGFTGSAGFGLVTPSLAWFFADPRYYIQARSECPEFELIECPTNLLEETAKKIATLDLPVLCVEKDYLTLGQNAKLQEHLPNVSFQLTDGIIESLRRVKEPGEVEAIRRACAIVDQAFQHILPFINEGVTERELAIELDFFLRRAGADRVGFDTIVAFGPHSAYPHAQPSDLALQPGQFVKMDYGAQRDRYNSDLTRTVVFGPETPRHREIYTVVRDAQRLALEAIRPGITGKDADAAARAHIEARGFGDNFGHGLGHGLGREVHDGGALNRTSELILEPGQVWTVEPGIYVEGFGGVRIEDDVVVTESGCEILTAAPKDFTVID